MKLATMLFGSLAVLGLLVYPAMGAEPREADAGYTLVIKKFHVEKTNKDGKAWDLNNGKPDVQVIVRNVDDKDGKEFRTKTRNDTYEAELNEPTTIKVRPGQTVEFLVTEKDFDLDDEIGKTRVKIEKAGEMKMEKFGRVITLVVDVRKL